ncbi:hypothetical protein QWY81_13270 [Polaribacter undariae]|uniref:DUF2971 domain-containing protein n=1 Tax=Polaribacter sejongensis TaxID=985043 RepID=A0AAJ1QZF9_9FLAO|nr:hypothetical protein [Polaribacter undariae]MDN3620431.1 hypothetical protein [Polaribacter undariae]UWD32830.1 hypothetical protein NQP51_03920 [Polaribacter undariae]
MDKIFRLRPIDNFTIEELNEGYLWFSRPTEYKDNEDSNIFSFIKENESIDDSFNRIYTDNDKIGKLSKLIGICCFTKTLPKLNIWKIFPKGYNGIFIEYDKNIIEQHFIDTIGLGDCFKNVEYISRPTLFKSYSKHDIIWKNYEDGGASYKSLREIEKDPRLLDQLFLKMFTRINEKFSSQNEARIIIANENIPDYSENIKGYKIKIPKKSILNIHVKSNTSKKFIKTLNDLDIKITVANTV